MYIGLDTPSKEQMQLETSSNVFGIHQTIPIMQVEIIYSHIEVISQQNDLSGTAEHHDWAKIIILYYPVDTGVWVIVIWRRRIKYGITTFRIEDMWDVFPVLSSSRASQKEWRVMIRYNTWEKVISRDTTFRGWLDYCLAQSINLGNWYSLHRLQDSVFATTKVRSDYPAEISASLIKTKPNHSERVRRQAIQRNGSQRGRFKISGGTVVRNSEPICFRWIRVWNHTTFQYLKNFANDSARMHMSESTR